MSLTLSRSQPRAAMWLVLTLSRAAALAWLCWGGSAYAGCPASPEEVERAALQAASAFSSMDATAFSAARERMQRELSCLSAPPSASQAALVHQTEALAWFQQKDGARTLAALRAMHESDPSWVLIPELAPPGGPLSSQDVEAQALPQAARSPLDLAPGLRAEIDGWAASDRPVGRDALVVLLGQDGRIVWSGLLFDGATIASPWLMGGGGPGQPAIATAVHPTGSAQSGERAGSARPWWLATGGATLLAGGLWVAFVPGLHRIHTIEELTSRETTDDVWRNAGLEPMSSAEVLALRGRLRGIELGAEIASGAAIGLCGVSLVVSR